MPAPPLSIRGVYDALRVPTLRDLVFSAKAFLAGVLALIVGFSQDLQNPYWAVMTVYIVLTPPEAGAIRSKAIFRLVGTVAGGMTVMAVTGLFGDQLGVLVAATIAIVAAFIYLKQIDRTPLNYLWMSSGLTAGVVGLTNLMQPANTFSYATARMGEIALGILTITAVDSLFWPRAMTPDFLKSMTAWRAEARDWMIDALSLTAEQSPDEERRAVVRQRLRDLTKAVGEIDAKAVQLPFDVIASAPRSRHLNLLRRQIVEVIADQAAIEVWARSLRRERTLRANLGPALDKVSAWLAEGPAGPGVMIEARVARGEALIEELAATRSAIDPALGRAALTERGLLTRLMRFVRDWTDLALAFRAIESRRRLPPRLEQLARRAKPVRSADYLGALFDVAPMLLSMTIATSLWYFTAWNSGAGALLFSFVGGVFLAGQGGVLRSGTGMLILVLIAFATVFLYQFAVLPRVTDFPVLVAVLACALFPFGLVMAMSMAGMLMCVYIFAFLGLQNLYAADFEQSLQTLSASLVGLLIALGCLYLCAYDHARFAARRLVTAARQDVLDIARSRRVPDRERFLFLAVDRLALYFPAAEQVAAGGAIPRLRMIDDFGIGINLIALRQHEGEAGPAARATIDALRDVAADAYRAKLRGHPDDRAFLAAVDGALGDPAIQAEPARDLMLEALAGMHLALADAAAPPPGEAVPL